MDDVFERGRNLWIQGGNWCWFVLDDCGKRLGSGFAVKCTLPANHFIQERAERKLIGAKICRQAARLLGRHIVYRPEQDSLLSGRRRPIQRRQWKTRREFAQPEVQYLR